MPELNNKYAKLRSKLAMSQNEFWSRVGITQSGGSRYEGGRNPAKPIVTLLTIAYGSQRERERAIKQLTGTL